MSLLDTLKNDVEAATTIEQSVVNFISGFAGLIEPLLQSGAVSEIGKLIGEAKARAPEFGQAALANTSAQHADGA